MASGIDEGKNKRVDAGSTINSKLLVSSLVGVLLISFLSLQYYLPLARHSNKHNLVPYNTTLLTAKELINNGEKFAYRIVVVTDLDHASKHGSKQHTWQSFLLFGRLIVDANLQNADIEWESFKAEWMTVKDNLLYVGGLGKEWTTPQGAFVNHNPMYVKVVSHSGEVKHMDWVENYKKIRKAVDIEYPGYMIHESGQWSEHHKRWFFLPRRASKEQYSESTDEFKGTNILLIADEHFTEVKYMEVGGTLGDQTRGFSAFQFLPETNNDIIVALKSEERDGLAVGSFIVVFSVSTGKILLEEKSLTGPYKFEGLAFI